MAEYFVRRAKKEDCAEIMELIKAIADFHHTPEYTMTKERLEQDGFGAERRFGCFVAEATTSGDGKPSLLGYTLYYNLYTGFWGKGMQIENLLVREGYRGQGIGQALLVALAKESLETGCYHIDFMCMSWNKEAINFYEKYNAQNMTENFGHQIFHFQSKDIEKIASL